MLKGVKRIKYIKFYYISFTIRKMFSKRLIIPQMIKRINYHTNTSSSTPTAYTVFENSPYKNVDFKIEEDMLVKEALNKFTALNIGCLAVTNTNKHIVGVISTHDYIHKVAVLDKDPNKLKIKDICTYNPNIIVVKSEDSLDICINKMVTKDIHHLLIIDYKNYPYNYYNFVGLLSMKDVIKEMLKNNKETITRLYNFNLGKGAFFGNE
jgi:CBS domain-containing protein